MKIGKVFATAFLLVLTSAPAWGIEPLSRCQELDKWVSQLDELPADFASFTALEPGQRAAVYKKLSNDQRAALWHEQLGRELAKDGWNAAQRALIGEIRSFVSADNLAAQQSGIGSAAEAARAATAGLETRVKQVFPREEAQRLFYSLGPSAASPTRSGLSDRCDCTEGYVDECGPIGVEECVYGFCHDPRFCGFQWAYLCNGNCRPV